MMVTLAHHPGSVAVGLLYGVPAYILAGWLMLAKYRAKRDGIPGADGELAQADSGEEPSNAYAGKVSANAEPPGELERLRA